MIIDNYITSNTSRSKFKYWFKNIDDRQWNVIDRFTDDAVIGTIAETDIENCFNTYPIDDKVLDLDAIRKDFELFKSRPEYQVFNYIHSVDTYENYSIDQLFDVYECLLVGCTLLRLEKLGNKDPDIFSSKVNNMLDWLNHSDFKIAPASTKYHGAYPGGLLIHTLNVVTRILELRKIPTWKDKVKVEDAIFVALVHDWCKIGLYEPYFKNVKQEDGSWKQETAYRYKSESMTCLGHGVSSMFLTQQFFKLSIEEALAIRWHMGEYNVADNEMNELHQANETYPLVQLLQFADRLSIVKYL